MMEDRLDERIREAASEYNRPPETPREAMWAAIQQARKNPPAPRRWTWHPLIWGGLAAAAILVLGILIGRWSSFTGQPNTPPQVAARSNQPPNAEQPALRIAAAQYLGQTEEFLTSFRADLRQGSVDRTTNERARDLLSTTRLLMDSPAGQDPKLKPLLQDLELVLAEIAQLPRNRSSREEAGFIDQGLEKGGLLPRLRTAVPAGQSAIGL
jgi:hypothetical protein